MRQTEDWGTVTWETLEPPWTDVSRVDLEYRVPWDKAFKVPYFEYRRRLKEIAMSAWTLDFIHCDPKKLANRINDDDYIIPSDDDDWFNPAVEDFLLSSDEEFISWDSIVNRMAYRFAIIPHKKFNKEIPIPSNGYAIKGSVIKRASGKQRWEMLMSHTHADKVTLELGCSVLNRKDLLLGLYNWHIGSMSALVGLQDPLCIRGLLPKNSPVALPKEWEWAEPQFSQVLELVQSL